MRQKIFKRILQKKYKNMLQKIYKKIFQKIYQWKSKEKKMKCLNII